MESKTLPAADTFILHKIIINESFNYSDIVLWTKEYAVLFAKWHVKEAIDRCVELAPYDKGIYENAYPESQIV